MQTIQIHELTRDYGCGKGIFDITFAVDEGEAFGYLGPNGAGKTTTLRHLCGFLKAVEGTCTIGGVDCFDGREKIMGSLGYIPGEMALFDDMEGGEFLQFIRKYRGRGLDRTGELLERFQVETRGKIRKMSKGMKQKVGIVAAFMHDPQVLILDEPTSGLDPLMQNRFIELLQEEKKKGKTILLSSHQFEEVEKTCNKVGMIREGHLQTVDNLENIKREKQRSFWITFSTEYEAKVFLDAVYREGMGGRLISPLRIEVTITTQLQRLLELMVQFGAVDLETQGQGLESAFLKYYGEETTK